MILGYSEIEAKFCFDEEKVQELVLENQKQFYRSVRSLGGSEEFDQAQWYLQNNGKELNFARSVFSVENVFDLNFGDRKIVARLHEQFLKAAMDEDEYQPTNEIRSAIVKYFDQVIHNHLDERFVQYNEDFSVVDLCKALGLHIEVEGLDFAESLFEYIKLLIESLGFRLLVIVNGRTVLADEQFTELVKMLRYSEYPVLFLENKTASEEVDHPRVIVDVDLCEL